MSAYNRDDASEPPKRAPLDFEAEDEKENDRHRWRARQSRDDPGAKACEATCIFCVGMLFLQARRPAALRGPQPRRRAARNARARRGAVGRPQLRCMDGPLPASPRGQRPRAPPAGCVHHLHIRPERHALAADVAGGRWRSSRKAGAHLREHGDGAPWLRLPGEDAASHAQGAAPTVGAGPAQAPARPQVIVVHDQVAGLQRLHFSENGAAQHPFPSPFPPPRLLPPPSASRPRHATA